MPDFEQKIEAVVDTILQDYSGNRDIDKMEQSAQPDKDVIIDIIDKLRRIVFPGYFKEKSFRIYNAKNWNDYADGIATDLNIKTFYDPAAFDNQTYTNKDIVFYYFPLPLDDWDNFYYNGALQAALADMIGKSAKTHDIFGMNSAGGSGVSNSTRSSSSQFGTIMKPIIDRQKDMRGMYVTKESIEAQREKQNN